MFSWQTEGRQMRCCGHSSTRQMPSQRASLVYPTVDISAGPVADARMLCTIRSAQMRASGGRVVAGGGAQPGSNRPPTAPSGGTGAATKCEAIAHAHARSMERGCNAWPPSSQARIHTVP